MTEKKRRQHYVPRFYLKFFSWDDRKIINIYNISRKEIIFNAKLAKQCYEDYFYGKDLIIDNSLGTIEDVAPLIIKNIIHNKSTPAPSSTEYQIILLYVLHQYARTKSSAEIYNEFINKLGKILIKKSGKMTDDELDCIQIRYTNPTIKPLGDISLASPLAMDLKCKILINETKLNFITSDNPVVFYNKALENIDYGNNVGIAIQGLKIIFPISPKHILLFYDDKIYKVGKKRQLFSYIFKENDVRQFNKLQWLNAHKNIFFDKNMMLSEITKAAEINIPKRNTEKYFINELEENLLHSYKSDFNIAMNMDCIKQLKTVTLDNGRKPVRNPEMVELHNEFSKLVFERKYDGSEFKEFLLAKQLTESS